MHRQQDKQGVSKVAGAKQTDRDQEPAEGGWQRTQTLTETDVWDGNPHFLLDRERDQCGSQQSRYQGQREERRVFAGEQLQKCERGDRSHNRAAGVHHTLEPKCPTVTVASHCAREQRLADRRAHAAP